MNLNGYLWNAQDARVGWQMGKEEEKKATQALEDGKETFVCGKKKRQKKEKETGWKSLTLAFFLF